MNWLRDRQDGSGIFRLRNGRDGSAILRLRSRQFPCFFLLCPQKTWPLFLHIPHKNPCLKINDQFIVAGIMLSTAKSANVFRPVVQLFPHPQTLLRTWRRKLLL